ncbi:calcium-dependent phosphotriesterase [Aulographum hederae CBS 113979]|uniref:Calcium-dependent phosphotriesterase n=1 Tax=Aulographum hederae CBS 113979 TaxID=1176131 RepID=A0A6G1H258_9PEZI|nr:calcium-dependent phosphotriesterase [Aulographum hederae CBS 113979]
MSYASPWKIHDDGFEEIIGAEPKLEVLLEVKEYPFAHEAGVFIQERNELFITSNRIQEEVGNPKVQITKITLPSENQEIKREEIHCDAIQMGNGGVNYQDGILFCDQGSRATPSGLYKMATTPPYATEEVLTSFHGRPFNSTNDVVIAKDGSIWFTDPIYGFEQGYRPKPRLPNQVYRYEPRTKAIRVVADGFGRPNGICFSPDECVVYVTDTDWIHGDGSMDGTRPSSM